MLKFFPKMSHKKGMPPGSLVRVGEPVTNKTVVELISYGPDRFRQTSWDSSSERPAGAAFSKSEDPVTWIDINGLSDTEAVKEAGRAFDLHPLILEDILNTEQRPKVEEYDGCLFIVLKLLYYSEGIHNLRQEQISLVLKDGLVLSFQESDRDFLLPVKERISKSKGRIRQKGADYLIYAVADTVVDEFFLLMEKTGERIETLEEMTVSSPGKDSISEIHSLKRNMLYIRKILWPHREVFSKLSRYESPLIKNDSLLFFRDIHDHVIQVIETVEISRDMISGLVDIFLSSQSNKMNDIMKVLTMFASIFIPLTFIAGIYGMNFKTMPELEWVWGYPVVLGIMFFAAGGMLYYFRKKGWL
ncbi:MAG: magnesium/cobalt transporter CorA [Fibrobacterota bacterium]